MARGVESISPLGSEPTFTRRAHFKEGVTHGLVVKTFDLTPTGLDLAETRTLVELLSQRTVSEAGEVEPLDGSGDAPGTKAIRAGHPEFFKASAREVSDWRE